MTPAGNAEIVRQIYETGLIDRDHDRLLALTDPEVEYVNPPEAVDPGIRRGKAEVAQALRNISSSFDAYRHELREVYDAGDAVVALVDFCTRSRGSEVEIVQEEAHTWTFREGRIVRHEWCRDLAAALEAVGLEPLR
jgi:ketosteroid isomerase-like protein